ncbi:MAG TPA: hypothetical protein VLA96_04185 [Terriglobales bacterium]|nr:hypothetical protein [Terriglobales bacterium]
MKKRALVILCALALSLPVLAQDTRPQLGTRPSSDSYDRPDAIPEGTTFTIRLRDTLDTRKIERGKKFEGEIQEDLVAPNGLLIPRGRKVAGHVSEFTRGINGRLTLSFDKIETRKGWVPLAATVVGVPGEHGVEPRTGEEGEISRKGINKKRLIESLLIGGAVGAAAGAIAGGGKGAAIGAAVGAAAGGGAGVLTDRDVKIEKGQALELRLDRPVIIPSR